MRLLSGILSVAAVQLVLSSGLAANNQSRVEELPARTPDIHFTPTRHNIADAMLRLANVTADDVVYDLGSGDGRLPIIAAQKYGARGVGIEIDPRLVEISWRIANEAEVVRSILDAAKLFGAIQAPAGPAGREDGGGSAVARHHPHGTGRGSGVSSVAT